MEQLLDLNHLHKEHARRRLKYSAVGGSLLLILATAVLVAFPTKKPTHYLAPITNVFSTDGMSNTNNSRATPSPSPSIQPTSTLPVPASAPSANSATSDTNEATILQQENQARCDQDTLSYNNAVTGDGNGLINEEKQIQANPPLNMTIALQEVNDGINNTNGIVMLRYNDYIGYIKANRCTSKVAVPQPVPKCEVANTDGISICETIVLPSIFNN